ncbi:phosphatase PAP2 family protein [Kineococcus rhizosphaerae]|uniref:phosphatase PAP2 family protein n=1 Tax=Kineococcus rhizosphaerae TaxID=559628 RepID=UPI001B809BF0|nr:phosphatase PAP2 family protein [Kineococcus rhizosphaerae]
MTGRHDDPDAALDDGRAQDFVGSRDLTRWPTAAGRRLAGATLAAGHRLAPHQVLLLTLLIGLGLTAALAATTDAVYDSVVEDDGVARLDHPVLALAVHHRTPLLDTWVTGFTHVGGPVGAPVLAVAAAVGFSLAWRSRTPAVLTVATMLGSLLLTVAGKDAVTRARPPHVDAVPPYEWGFSFPSGHALNAVALAGIVAYLLLRRLRRAWARRLTVALAIVYAAAMGLSRVFLGHHWLTDVLVGWVLGLAWLSVVITSHRLFLTVRRARAR